MDISDSAPNGLDSVQYYSMMFSWAMQGKATEQLCDQGLMIHSVRQCSRQLMLNDIHAIVDSI